ncbi:helix-turn-helix domain-containing protein [Ornithobacterium rhinotracheale]
MNIKARIKEQGWTLEQLAKEMTNRNGEKGISQPSVSQVINGNPTLDKLQEIAGIIGISVSELLSEKKDSGFCCPNCGTKLKIVKE